MVSGTLALLWYFVMVAVMGAGQRLRREPEETKSCRTGGICPSVCPSLHPSIHMSVHTSVHTVHTYSPRFTGLCLLRFPPEPLPCSHNCYHYKILEQGKGTDDNLVQENTFSAIMIRSTFYPNPISSKMMSRKFHPSSSMAYLHKCPLNELLRLSSFYYKNN